MSSGTCLLEFVAVCTLQRLAHPQVKAFLLFLLIHTSITVIVSDIVIIM